MTKPKAENASPAYDNGWTCPDCKSKSSTDFGGGERECNSCKARWPDSTNKTERKNNTELCGKCGASMTMYPDAAVNSCGVCGDRLVGAQTPAVERLDNFCRGCRHPIAPEHDDFGCNIPDCTCTMTDASIVDQIAAVLPNAAGACVMCGHPGAETLKIKSKGGQPTLLCADCAEGARLTEGEVINAGEPTEPVTVQAASEGKGFNIPPPPAEKKNASPRAAQKWDSASHGQRAAWLKETGSHMEDASKSFAQMMAQGGSQADMIEALMQKLVGEVTRDEMASMPKTAPTPRYNANAGDHQYFEDDDGEPRVMCGGRAVPIGKNGQKACSACGAQVSFKGVKMWNPQTQKYEVRNAADEDKWKDQSDYNANGGCKKCGWGAPGTGHTSGYHKDGCAILKKERQKFEHLQGAERRNAASQAAFEDHTKACSGCANALSNGTLDGMCEEGNKLLTAENANPLDDRAKQDAGALWDQASDAMKRKLVDQVGLGIGIIQFRWSQMPDGAKQKLQSEVFGLENAKPTYRCEQCAWTGATADEAYKHEISEKHTTVGGKTFDDDENENAQHGPFDQPNPMGCNGCDDSRAPLNKHGYCQACAAKQGPLIQEKKNAVAICQACLAAHGPRQGAKTITKGDIAHIVIHEGQGHTEVACGDESVCPCQNSAEHKNARENKNSGNCETCEKAAGRPLDEVESTDIFTKDHRFHLIAKRAGTSLTAACGAQLTIPENQNAWVSKDAQAAAGASRYGSGR